MSRDSRGGDVYWVTPYTTCDRFAGSVLVAARGGGDALCCGASVFVSLVAAAGADATLLFASFDARRWFSKCPNSPSRMRSPTANAEPSTHRGLGVPRPVVCTSRGGGAVMAAITGSLLVNLWSHKMLATGYRSRGVNSVGL